MQSRPSITSWTACSVGPLSTPCAFTPTSPAQLRYNAGMPIRVLKNVLPLVSSAGTRLLSTWPILTGFLRRAAVRLWLEFAATCRSLGQVLLVTIALTLIFAYVGDDSVWSRYGIPIIMAAAVGIWAGVRAYRTVGDDITRRSPEAIAAGIAAAVITVGVLAAIEAWFRPSLPVVEEGADYRVERVVGFIFLFGSALIILGGLIAIEEILHIIEMRYAMRRLGASLWRVRRARKLRRHRRRIRRLRSG